MLPCLGLIRVENDDNVGAVVVIHWFCMIETAAINNMMLVCSQGHECTCKYLHWPSTGHRHTSCHCSNKQPKQIIYTNGKQLNILKRG